MRGWRRMAVGVLALMTLAAAPPPPRAALHVGDPAPDFQVTLVDGHKVWLHDLRGQVVVLNFWATWCVPCRAELPLLDSYYRTMQSHGLKVFAVTTEDSVPIPLLHRLFNAMTITPARAISRPYGIMRAVPTNYIIGRDGRLRYAQAAAFSLDDLNRLLVPLLNEPVPTA